MKALGEFLKSTIIGGVLIILPLGLVIVIVMKFVSMLKPLAQALEAHLPDTFRFPMLLAIALLLILSFAAGLLALTRVGRRTGRFIESSFLNSIPGYPMMRTLTERIGDRNDTAKFAPAFVEIEEALVLAFIIEEHEDGKYTVFVPSAPTPTAGSIYVMEPSRVHFIDAPFIKAVRCVSKFGVGSEELMKSLRQPTLT
jgi:uncharacterized membrane protein